MMISITLTIALILVLLTGVSVALRGRLELAGTGACEAQGSAGMMMKNTITVIGGADARVATADLEAWIMGVENGLRHLADGDVDNVCRWSRRVRDYVLDNRLRFSAETADKRLYADSYSEAVVRMAETARDIMTNPNGELGLEAVCEVGAMVRTLEEVRTLAADATETLTVRRRMVRMELLNAKDFAEYVIREQRREMELSDYDDRAVKYMYLRLMQNVQVALGCIIKTMAK